MLLETLDVISSNSVFLNNIRYVLYQHMCVDTHIALYMQRNYLYSWWFVQKTDDATIVSSL
jgi:hypothetical protein